MDSTGIRFGRKARTYLDLLSEKQQEFVYESDAFLNLAHGAVRSGKTHAALLRLVAFCRYGPPGTVMLLGKTRDTVERNVVFPLQELYPEQVRYNRGLGRVWIKDRVLHMVGANDAQAYSKIRGSTLAGAYTNELTLFPKDVLETLIDRCSIDGAQIFADTNPDSPFHWVKQDYLDNEEISSADLKAFHFGLDDNPVLAETYKARLKRMHSGVWYKRMVDGLWVLAEGMIYDSFDPDGPMVVDVLPATFEQVVVGVDYGTNNPTAFLKLGRSKGKWYVFDEYYHDSKAAGRQKTDAEYAADFVDWVQPHVPSSVEVDPSAASFKLELKRNGISSVRDAENEVLDGIRRVAVALNENTLYIARWCQETIKSLSVYAWDPKAQLRGEDKPLKQNDHPADALRYAGFRVFGQMPTTAPVGVGRQESYWLSAP